MSLLQIIKLVAPPPSPHLLHISHGSQVAPDIYLHFWNLPVITRIVALVDISKNPN